MLSNPIKKGLWLWIGLCVALWVGSRQPQLEQYADLMADIATFGLWGGMAIFLVALLIVHHIEKSRAGKRLTELYWRVQSGETVEIRGDTGLFRLIPTLMITGLFVKALFSGAYGWDVYALCLGLAIAMIVILVAREVLTVIPLLRQPILRISREALESPVFGKLSWRDIDQLHLDEREARGFTFHYRLRLLVPRLPSLTEQLHPATRLQHRSRSLFRPNNKLYLRLLRTSELPKVILTLCQRTGSEYMNYVRLGNKDLLAEPPMEPRRAPSEYEAKLNAQIDALGFKEALHQMREDTRKKRDELWEMSVTPPRELMRTHWTTWVATVIVAVFIVGFIYLLYSAPA
jgi:hypothetical protein